MCVCVIKCVFSGHLKIILHELGVHQSGWNKEVGRGQYSLGAAGLVDCILLYFFFVLFIWSTVTKLFVPSSENFVFVWIEISFCDTN